MIKQKKSMNKAKSKSNATGSIRIISGKHRGRKLPVLMADGLRPTTDRVKETVFNWLMPYIQDSRCLDCFAGAGSLGFEALSRGAEHVTFLELNDAAAKQLQINKASLKAENVAIHKTDALSFLTAHSMQYSIIFIDPPFRQNLVEQTAILLENNCISNETLIYVEMELDGNNTSLPLNWHLLKEKNAGQVSYRLYRYGTE